MITARIKDNRIRLQTPFKFKEVCQSLPGRQWDGIAKEWHVPATQASMANIAEAFERVGETVDIQKAEEVVLTNDGNMLKQIQAMEDWPSPVLSKTDTWKHQRRAHMILDRCGTALFDWGMRSGKTKIVIDHVCNYKTEGGDIHLIVAPATGVPVWKHECGIHAGRDINMLALRKGTSTKKRIKAMQNAMRLHRQTNAFVMNWEILGQKLMQEFLLDYEWDSVIPDESHRGKAPNGVWSKFLAILRDRAKKRFILTGTVMPHSPADIWAQYRFLDPSIFGESFTLFKHRYAVEKEIEVVDHKKTKLMGRIVKRKVKVVKDWKMLDELREKIYSIGDQVKTEDVIDVPEAADVYRIGVLDKETSKVYKQLENEVEADVKSGKVTISNGLTRLLRLQQACNGFIPLDNSDGITLLGNDRLKIAKDIYTEEIPNEPIVTFCRFKPDMDMLTEMIKKDCDRPVYSIRGGLDENIDWKNGKEKDAILISQIQSGKECHDWSKAAHVLYYSIGFSLGDFLQSYARIGGARQKRKRTYMFIKMETYDGGETVDHLLYDGMTNRKKLVEYVVGKLKNK